VEHTAKKMMVNRRADIEGDLVGCLLPLGALDQVDHAIEEPFSRIGGDAHDQPVREHAGAAGNGAAISTASR